MDKNQIIEQAAKDKVVEEIVYKVARGQEDEDDLKDLISDIYLNLLEKDDELIEILHNKGDMKFYISRMVVNSILSKNSRYYYIYKKMRKNKISIDEINL